MAIAILRIWQIPNALRLLRTRDKLRPFLQQEMVGKTLQRLRTQTAHWGHVTGMSITLCPRHFDPIKQFKAILGHFLKHKS